MTVPGSLYTPTIRKTRASAYLLEQSLLFNLADSAYLNRTPSSTGDVKTWTFSAWVKFASGTNYNMLMGHRRDGAGASTQTQVTRSSSGALMFYNSLSGSTDANLSTEALFRDTSAWYHIVYIVDTTEATDTNRVKIIVNGTQQTIAAGADWPALNATTRFNEAGRFMYVGALNDAADNPYLFHDGLMAEAHFFDGAALAATNFGEEDADGYWIPIEYTGGSYGTNGFQLDFADTSNFGADVNYTGDTSVTFTASAVNTSAQSSYTFSSQAIGTASSDRVVVVGTSGGSGATDAVSSMTIGGVSAVKAIGIVNNTGTEIWYATVPTGTTASIVVNWGGTKNRSGIGVWALTGVSGIGATNTSSSSTSTLTVSGNEKDIVIVMWGGKDHSSVSISGVTENFDSDITGVGSQYMAGGFKKLTSSGSNAITVTPNAGATEVAAVSAVFLATGNNSYLSNNFTTSDQLEDSPTDSANDGIGNFATGTL